MKVYTLLLATTVSSVFWSAAADKGSLRGFGTRIARALDGFLADEQEEATHSWEIALDGDNGAATVDDDMDWAEELMTCLGITAESLTFSETEDLTSDKEERRLCNTACKRRRKRRAAAKRRVQGKSSRMPKDGVRRRDLEGVNACMAEYCETSRNPACGLSVESVTGESGEEESPTSGTIPVKLTVTFFGLLSATVAMVLL